MGMKLKNPAVDHRPYFFPGQVALIPFFQPGIGRSPCLLILYLSGNNKQYCIHPVFLQKRRGDVAIITVTVIKCYDKAALNNFLTRRGRAQIPCLRGYENLCF